MENVVDKQVDVKSGNRVCPNCNYEYSKKEYFKKLYFNPTWKSWDCAKCGISLKFDLKKRLINVLIIVLTLFVVFQIKHYFESKLIYVLVSILTLLLVTTTLFLFFDKIKLSNHNENK